MVGELRDGERKVREKKYDGNGRGVTLMAAWPLPVPASQATACWEVREASLENQCRG